MYYKCDVYCLVSLILRFYLFPINLLNSCFLSLSFGPDVFPSDVHEAGIDK